MMTQRDTHSPGPAHRSSFVSLVAMMVGLLTSSGIGVAQADDDLPPNSIEGVWLTNEGTFKVIIAPCDDKFKSEEARSVPVGAEADPAETEYCGTIVWARPFTEEEKAQYEEDGESFDTMEAIGATVLRNFVHAGGNEWKEGKFYVEARDKSYSTTLELASPDELDVKIRVALVFGKTVRWTRLEGDSASYSP